MMARPLNYQNAVPIPGQGVVEDKAVPALDEPSQTSLLLEKNVHPKTVSELLGHSTVTLTLNTYSHIINPMSSVAADAMDEIVGQ